MRTILLAATALAALTGCQSAAEKQRPQAEAQSGDLANCARVRVVPGGCGGNSGFAEVYVDNLHKDRAVRATVRKHSQQGDDDTEYAIAEGGQLFIGCGGGGTSFDVVGCEVLKGEAEKGDTRQLELPHTTKRFPSFLTLAVQNRSKLCTVASGTSPRRF